MQGGYDATGYSGYSPGLRRCRASETLVDIADDLYDYEEDVLKNSFNCFRMYVHMHGAGKVGGPT